MTNVKMETILLFMVIKVLKFNKILLFDRKTALNIVFLVNSEGEVTYYFCSNKKVGNLIQFVTNV